MSEVELVKAAQAGDRDAFRRLVEKYGSRVYWFCRRRVGTDEDARDLAQEVLVAAHESLPGLRDPAGFGGWLFGIARNRWRMRLRRLARAETPLDDLDVEPASAAEPEERLRLEGLKRLLEDLVGGLGGDQREVVELYYWDGLTYDEISAVLDVPKTTVKSRLHEARRSLRSTLRRSLRNTFRARGMPVGFADEVMSRCGEGCECGLTLDREGGE
jgi:RNA polymerase sigma-70 factor (ECF subfamily)